MPETNHSSRTWRLANAAAIAGIVFFAFYYLTAFRFDTLFTVPSRQVDFNIWRFVPGYILEHGRYPASATGDWEHALFPYLPSAAAMMLPLSWPPRLVAFALWLVIEGGAFAVALWAAMRPSGAALLPGRWVVAVAAVLLCENSLGWDFRNHNTNIVYLALVMLGLLSRRTWLSALLFALSVNLKLYSAFLPAVFAWRREFRLALAVILLTALIAVGVPLAVLGPAEVSQLFADWIAQIHYTLLPTNEAEQSAALIGSIAALLGVAPASGTANIALRAIQIAWLALVAFYYFFCARGDVAPGRGHDQLRLADICVALMMPLPLSTWLFPYHLVVLLPAYLLLLAVAAAEEWPVRIRVWTIAACIAAQIPRFVVHDWHYRGIVFLASFVVLVAALAMIRRSAARMVSKP
jgi:hypothetical protein